MARNTIVVGGGQDHRTQVGDLERSPIIRPAAAPVDTYYRPAEDAPDKPDLGLGGLADLAKALEKAEPSIQNYLQSEHKQYTEEELKKGAAERLANQTAFRDAIKKGLIPEGASPWFIKGYQQQEGRLDGMEYDTALRTAWSSSDVKESDDPAALTKFIGDFRTNFMKERGVTGVLDWQDGFQPMMDRAEANLSAQHVAHRQQEIMRKVRENTYAEVSALITNEILDSRQ